MTNMQLDQGHTNCQTLTIKTIKTTTYGQIHVLVSLIIKLY